MNEKKFSDAMSELNSKYIDETLNYKKKTKKSKWIKWGAMAACLFVVVMAAITVPSMLSPQESEGGGGGTIVDSDQNILQEAPTLFAKQSVIDAIKQDIAGKDIKNWAETENAIFNFEYVIPIYSTANAKTGSHTILETLAFDNQYMIPVISNEKCIGTATVAQHENKWVIAVYEQGFDFQSEVDKNKDIATCFVDVIQLNERGFLSSTDTEEFVAIPGFGISHNMSGQELLNRILENAENKDNAER